MLKYLNTNTKQHNTIIITILLNVYVTLLV